MKISLNGLKLIDPVSYLDMLLLEKNAKVILTDSGGIQEGTTYLGISCLTLRSNTERPITVLQDTNKLCKPENIEDDVNTVLNGKQKTCKVPELWDGKTGRRIVNSIEHFFKIIHFCFRVNNKCQ